MTKRGAIYGQRRALEAALKLSAGIYVSDTSWRSGQWPDPDRRLDTILCSPASAAALYIIFVRIIHSRKFVKCVKQKPLTNPTQLGWV